MPRAMRIRRFFGVFLALLAVGTGAFTERSAQAAQPNANAVSYATQSDPEILVLDARQAGRGLMYSHMTVPVRSGPFTMVYPKWIPGEHGPTGPLADIAQVKASANGRTLTVSRDQVHMYQFHIDVPPGVSHINVDFTVLVNGADVMSTKNLAVVNFNRDLFYQNDTNSKDDYFKTTVILPNGWDYGCALPVAARHGNRVDFDEVPLNMLVDSPLDMGRYYKHVVLWHGDGTEQVLDAFADHPQDLDFPANIIDAYKNMTPEALALYGSRHWNVYHSLLTLSNAVGFQGIEHHQSSDNRAPEDFMTNPMEQTAAGDLLTHEFSHSWNGKYRRPFDLWQPNFQLPEHTELLWVYEGMNQYLGDLLSFRTGIRKPSEYPEYLASIYAAMDNESGRYTTPLIDLTTTAPYLYQVRGPWENLRRTAGDFYTEGELVWLDADTIIRQLSHGTKSLDTFLHLYSAPALTGPITKTYTRADIEHLLSEVVPYDWHGFFQRYVYSVNIHPPHDDFARAGWRFYYDDKPNAFIVAADKLRHMDNEEYGIGLALDDKGKIAVVRQGSAAWNAGLGPGMTVIAVDGQDYSSDALRYVIREAQHARGPIVFTVDDSGWVGTYRVSYHGGLRYPHMARVPGVPDMLAQIMAPHRSK
jgi:predicted metalloprotease with PDZ domain